MAGDVVSVDNIVDALVGADLWHVGAGFYELHDFLTADGDITTAHWTATAVDGKYTASIYSTCSCSGCTNYCRSISSYNK